MYGKLQMSEKGYLHEIVIKNREQVLEGKC